MLIDDGSIAPQVQAKYPGGIDKVLELVGATTLHDSLRCAREGGIVCMTGIVGNKWSLEVNPMDLIPTAVCLTSYAGEADDFMRMPFDEIASQVASGHFTFTSEERFTSTRSSKHIGLWRRTRQAGK